MKFFQKHKPSRGMTLLETIAAITLGSVISLAAVTSLRTSYYIWNARESQSQATRQAQEALRHMVRRIREAQEVVEISDALNTTGFLKVTDPAAKTWAWAYNSNQILFGENTATALLAEGITALKFESFEKDGVTPTTTVADIQLIKVSVSTTLASGGGKAFTYSSSAWVRKQAISQGVEEHESFSTTSNAIPGMSLFANAGSAVHAPDDSWSLWTSVRGAQYSGFEAGTLTTVGVVQAGLYLYLDKNDNKSSLRLRYRLGAELGPWHNFQLENFKNFTQGQPGWWYADVSLDRASWLPTDIPNLIFEFEFLNEDGESDKGKIQVDSVKVRLYSGQLNEDTFWVNAEGTDINLWINPLEALNLPDSTTAQGLWNGDNAEQSYAYSFVPNSGKVIGVLIRMEAYLNTPLTNGEMDVRLTGGGNITRTLIPSDLNGIVGGQQTIWVDFTNLETWTWSLLSSMDGVRFHLKPDDIGVNLNVDAAALVVRYTSGTSPSIIEWDEQ